MKTIYFFLLFSVVIGSGCSTSRITNSWKESNAAAKPYKKILVLGLVGEPDRTFRMKMEEHMAGDLNDLGYNAVSSIQQYGPKAFEGMKEKEAIQQLADQGFDAVVTIVLLNKSKEKYYTPGNIYYSPYSSYHMRLWGYYTIMYDRVYSPDYYTEETKYFWESNLYDLDDWKLLYSVQSESFEPESARSLAHEYGLMIVNDMVNQNVLVNLKAPAKKAF
jgi:hypothetical protein